MYSYCMFMLIFLVQHLEKFVLNKEPKRVGKRICTIFIEFSTKLKKKTLAKYQLLNKQELRLAH